MCTGVQYSNNRHILCLKKRKKSRKQTNKNTLFVLKHSTARAVYVVYEIPDMKSPSTLRGYRFVINYFFEATVHCSSF